MSVFKRSILYVLRKKTKTIILFLIFLCMSTGIFSGIAIKKSMETAAEDITGQFSSSFRLQNSYEYSANTFLGEGIIPQSALEQILTVDGIESSIRTRGAMAILSDVKSVPIGFYSEYDEELQQTYGDFVYIESTSDTSKNSKFVAETFTLVSGSHLTEKDEHKVLVHEDFAKLNNLSVGDTFDMTASPMDRGNKKGSLNTVKVTVAGIFSGRGEITAGTRYDMFENNILADLKTIADLYDEDASKQMYSNIDFFLKPNYNLDKVMSEVKKLPIDWQKLDTIRNDRDIHGISGSIKGVFGMINTMITLIIVFSVLILSLILFLWLNGRKKEAGIMISVGVPKSKVVSQFIFELLIIATISFALSYFTGNVVSQTIGDKMVASSSQNTKQELIRSGGGLLSGDPETALLYKTIDKIEVTSKPEYLAYVYAIGFPVIILSVFLSSAQLIRLKPKDLLTQMK